jgi:hypothetical protein
MKNQEHMVAVVEPARDGESTIELAQQVVDRGGRATVLVVVTRDTVTDIAAFAEAEELRFPDAKEIYVERLAEVYSSRFGDHEVATIVTDHREPNRVAFDTAGKVAATTVAMPQRLATRRGWRASVARSQVPVLIAPPRAA